MGKDDELPGMWESADFTGGADLVRLGHKLTPVQGVNECDTCGGVQGSTLTTDCPGQPMTIPQEEGVFALEIDFHDGVWITR